MTTLPPPPTSGNGGPIDERAARLARLAERQQRSNQQSSGPSRKATANRPRPAQPSRSGSVGSSRGRKQHAAQSARTTALGVSLASTAGLVALFASINRPVSDASSSSPAALANTAHIATPLPARTTPLTANPSPAAAPSTTPSAAAGASSAAATDAPAPTAVQVTVPAQPVVVDGATFSNRWGNVQVEATFAPDGTLVDVVALQYPNDRRQSVRINEYAVPRLTNQALAAQTASVDTVSGATYTSSDYRRSLQSAIDTARAAGVTQIG